MTGAVLVTGASGLVGAEVVARLRAAGRPVIALLHAASAIVRNDGAVLEPDERLAGDIREPEFGGTAAGLVGRVSMIVHCAATTAFDATERQYAELNVRGTENVLALARRLAVPLVHVSTAYVCGMRGGTVLEEELEHDQGFGNGYEASKYRAEQLVRGSGLEWAVVRPGIVTGASGTGAIRDHKNLYTVLKLMVEGKLRSLPGRYDATLSLAPLDHVAGVIAAAATDFDRVRGRTLHALGRDTLSLREVSDVLAEYPSFAVATFVPESTFDEADLPPIEREYYRRIGALYTSYFIRRLRFDTRGADLLCPAPESGADYLRLLLDHSLEVGYLGDPLPSIEEILAGSGS